MDRCVKATRFKRIAQKILQMFLPTNEIKNLNKKKNPAMVRIIITMPTVKNHNN
jgi:hypothetical protein